MQLQRERDTAPELRLRRELHRRGLRYRLDRPVVPGTRRRRVDITFGPSRVAVFVDGCFWHGCPEHGQRAHDVNGWYWPNKIAGNKARDEDTDRRLVAVGWLVVRTWEHDDPAVVGEKIAAVVTERRASADDRRSEPPTRNRSHATAHVAAGQSPADLIPP